MKCLHFARRNAREILRDPLNVVFGLGFPLVLLLLMSLIQKNVPVPLFEIETLTPAIAVFGLAFIALFSATLIAKDRSSALMARLMASPLTAWDYILGYLLPLLPMAMAQLLIVYGAAALLGLSLSGRAAFAILTHLPAAAIFIAVGLICGTLMNDKQVGGVCGALLTNLTAWLSGAWFDLSLVGGPFEAVASCLPFVHAVNAGRAALRGESVLPALLWVSVYAAGLLLLGVLLFRRRMRRGQI